jgi:hypothetical protein
VQPGQLSVAFSVALNTAYLATVSFNLKEHEKNKRLTKLVGTIWKWGIQLLIGVP